MPIKTYALLLGAVIAAAALTITLTQSVGLIAALAPVALVLAWIVRRSA
jgi:hypothetical protein